MNKNKAKKILDEYVYSKGISVNRILEAAITIYPNIYKGYVK